ncbi:MAG: alpha/beta hydrolase [Acidobacteriota bacterium]|nr:alpha/beta hydrolase [Acidobacteriota bacterium]
MARVFVHGNPETDVIWHLLATELRSRGIDDLVTLSPPGFGGPRPDGFAATPAAYIEWLIEEIESIGGPVDLVGHDWGAGHVFGVVAERSDLVRSWACDVAGLLHPDYVWHDAAQLWQTADVGEQAIAGMVAQPVEERVQTYIGFGIAEWAAQSLAESMDDTMGECILALYRGAVPPYLTDLADRLAATDRRPGLILNPTADPYVSADLVPDVAERFGADVAELEGAGHWWMFFAHEKGAEALAGFWAGLD